MGCKDIALFSTELPNISTQSTRTCSDMDNEMNRLGTFHKRTLAGSVQKLVRNSLYYSDKDNLPRILCSKCAFVVNIEEQMTCDEILVQHSSTSPDCPAVLETNHRENPDTNTTRLHSTESDTSLNNLERLNLSESNEQNVYGQHFEPRVDRKNPDFELLHDEKVRLATFFDWPQQSAVKPAALAKAGLFYTGTSDRVQCAYCYGVLVKWEPHDVPTVEHQKYFPRCPFVMKNRQSATTLQNGHANVAAGFRNIDRRTIKARMDLPLVRSIIQKGYPADLVRAAIENQIATSGDDFATAEQLLSAVLDLQDCSGAQRSATDPGGGTENTSGDEEHLHAATAAAFGAVASNETTTAKQSPSVVKNNEDKSSTSNPVDLRKDYEKLKEMSTCKICMDADVDTLLLPCSHLVCCSSCAPRIDRCPICRTPIKGTIKTFQT